MKYLIKKFIKRSFLYKPSLQIRELTKIFMHDSQSFPIKAIRNYVRSRKFPQINQSSLPSIIHVEVTNLCNAGCVMCPQSNMKRKAGNMEDALYKKIIDQCGSLDAVWPFMMGEPLMDRKLPERIAYAKGAGIKRVGIFTNGSLLNLDMALKLLDCGIDHITISFDALTEKTFKQIRPGLSFQDVTANILNLVKLRRQRKQKLPFIAIEFVKMEKNNSEADEFRKKWDKIVDAVYISDMVNWAGANQAKSAKQLSYKIRRPCYMLCRDMVIFVDGRVALCCYDYESSIFLGDANKQSLKEIWNSEKLTHIRDLHLRGEFEKIPICSECNAWKMLSAPWWW
ncbi:MAG: radical SAM protein [bacterium]